MAALGLAPAALATLQGIAELGVERLVGSLRAYEQQAWVLDGWRDVFLNAVLGQVHNLFLVASQQLLTLTHLAPASPGEHASWVAPPCFLATGQLTCAQTVSALPQTPCIHVPPHPPPAAAAVATSRNVVENAPPFMLLQRWVLAVCVALTVGRAHEERG